MRKNLIFTASLIGNLLFSQAGINTDSPHSSSALDIRSEVIGNNKKGILIPRIELLNKADKSNNPARGLLVYNTETQNDVVKDNFYYFDGNKWKPLISNNKNKTLVIPEMSAVLRLETDKPVYSYADRQKIPIVFDRDILAENPGLVTNQNPSISYNKSNGTFTVQKDGIYAITLQVGLYKVFKEQDIIIGLTVVGRRESKKRVYNRKSRTYETKKTVYNDGDWLSRATFAAVYDNSGQQDNRTFGTYSAYIKFKRGEKFKAAIALDKTRSDEEIQGIQTGTTGDGNVTNISIIKY